MQNSRNLILFIIASFLILIGWGWLQQRLWPPPPPPAPKVQVERNAATLLAGSGVTGVDWVANLKGDPIELAAKPKEKARPAEVKPAEKKPEEPPPPREPAELIRLGNDSGDPWYLNVLLNKRGGSVQQVVLTQFQQASREGLPVKTADGGKFPLHLIPGVVEPRTRLMRDQPIPHTLQPGKVGDDVRLSAPSYVMFHYDRPDDDRPVDTLGVRDWDVVENKLEGDAHTIAFETELGAPHHVRIRKTFTLHRHEYHIGLKVEITPLEGRGKDAPNLRYQIAGPIGLPIEGEWYTATFRNALVGWRENDGSAKRFLGDAASIAYTSGTERITRANNIIQYAGIAVQYFASVLAVDNEQPPERQKFLEYVRATPEGPVDPERMYMTDITVRAITEELPVREPTVHQYLLYQGPVKVALLGQMEDAQGNPAVGEELVDRYVNQLNLFTLTDYHMPNALGRFANSIFWTDLVIFFTNLMHWILGGLNVIIPSLGLCILALTVLVRGSLHPLSRRQAANAARMQEKMAKLAPELKQLKEKHKGDLRSLQQAQMELYRKHGVNPLAMMGGCLLLILQMPIFMGLYFALQESIFFRLESFLWVPNLAAPDMLIRWGESIPWISAPESKGGLLYLGPYFNLLPIVAVALMLIQQKMLMPPPADEQQAAQQKMMKFMMILIGFLFYKIAAGICIYFIASTLWGVAERKLLPKHKPGAAAAEPAGAGKGAPDRGGPPQAGNGKRRKRKGGKPGKPSPKGPAEPESLGGKLKAWWEDILEKAKKK